MAAPCNETRAVFAVPATVAVRARTLRAAVAASLRLLTVALRAVTPRDDVGVVTWAALPRDVVVVRVDTPPEERDATGVVRDVALRETVVAVVAAFTAVGATAVRAVVVGRAVVPRDEDVVVPRGLARDTRDVAVARAVDGVPIGVTTSTGAMGSAKTARMDTNVEQTKNAAANKKTVPTAFLQ